MILFVLFFLSHSFAAELSRYRLNQPEKVFELPRKLREVSGITFESEQRLLAHQDERAIVYELDYPGLQGVIRQIPIGAKKPLHGDFEDIGWLNGKLFLLSSDGGLLETEPGQSGSVRRHETGLSARSDLEGLAWDPATSRFLLLCKQWPGRGFKHTRAVYSYSPETRKLDPQPRFLIQLASLQDRELKPSGIARHPVSGSFFILSSQHPQLIELSADGKLLAQVKLDPKIHPQPEGIAFDSKQALLIADEGGRRPGKQVGTITRYPRSAD